MKVRFSISKGLLRFYQVRESLGAKCGGWRLEIHGLISETVRNKRWYMQVARKVLPMDLWVKQGAVCIKDTLLRFYDMLGWVDLVLVDVQEQVHGVVI
jgi:hypothetical protein